MVSAGTILKEKRLASGLSLSQISQQTRITIAQLEAIEAGDVGYFQDDPSFYRFRALSYGRLLKVDEVELKKQVELDLDNYYQELSETQQLKKIQITENVKAKTELLSPRRRQIDLPWMSMILVIIIVIATLGFVFINHILNNQPEPVLDEGVAVEFPLVITPKDDIEIPDVVIPKEFSINKVSGTNFEIYNANPEPILNIIISRQTTYLWFKKNGSYLANPKSGEKYGDLGTSSELKVPLSIVANDLVELEFGLFSNIKLEIDGTEIPLNATYPTNRVKIVLVFKEE